MLVAFVLMTKNTSIRYFIIKTCCHYTLNGTNNTQMLHCEHEDDLSHMLYFILKDQVGYVIGFYASYNTILHILSIIYYL